MNGRAAFAPDAVGFIQSLPDNGTLSIKATRSADGKVKEGKFDLGAVSEVRGKIAKACDWADGSMGGLDSARRKALIGAIAISAGTTARASFVNETVPSPTTLRLMNPRRSCDHTQEAIAEVHNSFAVLFIPLFSGRT